MMTILIADDEPAIVDLVRFTLEDPHVQIVDAADGAAAVELARRERPDVALLDVQMPRLNGLDVCRQVRKTSDVPILFLTARDEEIDRILGLGALYVLALVAFLTGGPMMRELAGARSVLLALGLVFGGLTYVFFRPGIARRVVSASGLARLPWALKRFETVQSAVHVYRAQMHAVWIAFLGSVALQAIVVYYYFTTASFMTTGIIEFKDGKILTHEDVKGDAGGVSEVRATSEILPGGAFHVKAEYFKDGQWKLGHEVTYKVDASSEVVFK